MGREPELTCEEATCGRGAPRPPRKRARSAAPGSPSWPGRPRALSLHARSERPQACCSHGCTRHHPRLVGGPEPVIFPHTHLTNNDAYLSRTSLGDNNGHVFLGTF